jgi:pimeloyl-ACP methyl ester carboxylesterase
MKKNIQKLIFGFILLWICFAQSNCYMTTFRRSDKETLTYFKDKGLDATISYYMSNGRKIRYASIGNDTLPAILMIHGAPSSLNINQRLLADSLLRSKAKLYAIDRPGYGYSGLGKPVTSIEQQAKMIIPLLENIRVRHKKIILEGISFGGPISVKIAALRPDLVDGILLGAPAIAPGQETYFDISYAMRVPILKYMFPRMLVVATDEKWAHRKELEKMLPDWASIRVPIIYVQGENDEIVNPKTTPVFAKAQLINVPSLEIVMIPNQKHFLTFPQHKLLVEKLVALLDK